MKKRKIHSRKELQALRKELRNRLTPAEATLWKHLKSKQLQGRRFQRQHSIERYIVDFYCASEKLIIELDGQGHYTPQGMKKDAIRTERLQVLGFTVIRFENKMVFDQLPLVLATIQDHFKTGV
ncbi:endonuclease domain-containing protein [Aquimarina algicola]|uniref:Endonuclease domain-containing protein n=1 Tax=Aquimarina algicola TaxID=2589995 RepID=A0A504JLI0_9FLAO|nr:endonuclease domain-containing protein [Aquimarina algicola]TPN87441.1 endonuclease domain-containing protein [Aquimarina algicola]